MSSSGSWIPPTLQKLEPSPQTIANLVFFPEFLLGIIVEVEVVFDSDMRHLLLNQKEASDGLGGKGSGVDGREACDIKVLCVY